MMTRGLLLVLAALLVVSPVSANENHVRRRLQGKITREEAEKACAKHGADNLKACIFDVMSTGDLDMAESY